MGMYTELIFGGSLKKDTPKEVINTLRYYCGQGDYPENLLEFRTKSGRNPLNNGGSYYFGVHNSQPQMYFDSIGNNWVISSRTNLKNYEDEIEDFLKWITPYMYQGSGLKEMIAIVTYEQGDPKIYYLSEEND